MSMNKKTLIYSGFLAIISYLITKPFAILGIKIL
jgi:hypothetical protein